MIFLSHNYKDKPVVRQIAQTLESVYGQENVFYDEWSIQPGDSIIENMNQGLEKCRYFFFFVSENSLASNMVKLEWQAALMKINSGIKFIPIRLDKSTMPAILAQTLYIDLFTYGLETSVRQIIDVINGQNTFRPRNDFSNLIAEITQNENVTVEIRAEYYLEPHSRYLILVNNQRDDFVLELPDFSVYESAFNENVQFSNGMRHNCLLIAVSSATSPEFPIQVVLKPRNDAVINVLWVMHATSRTDFASIPVKWKG